MKAVITVSKTFFPKHPKAGEATNFAERVKCGQKIRNHRKDVDCLFPYCGICGMGKNDLHPKIHTCRSNYEYWAKKIARIKETGGVLSVRQWIGKPYKKPGQETIIDIPAEIVGVQKLTFERNTQYPAIIDVLVDGKYVNYLQLANNDGLSMADFEAWFKGYNLQEPMAIIHFTKYRYGK